MQSTSRYSHLITLPALCLALSISLAIPVAGQNFYSHGGTIPNNSVGNCFTQTVTGVGTMTATNGLMRVCLSIDQARPADMDIFLRSPDGTTIALSTDNGGTSGNDYYYGVCFSDCGPSGSITLGADFRGVYTPETSLGAFNGGTLNANGVWQLCIDDDNATGVAGKLNFWSLDFGTPVHPATPNAATCATAYNLTTLPYSHTCMTLAGQPNTYSACTGAMDGADYLFAYTPTTPEEYLSVDIAQDFGAPSGFPTVTLLDVCPNLAMPVNCIQSEIQFTSTENILYITSQPLTMGVTYYVVVSSTSGTGGVFDVRISSGRNGNDDCLSATEITSGVEYAGNNYTATIPSVQAPSTAEMTCNGSIDNFVFYTFTTDASGSPVYVDVTDIACDIGCGGSCGIQLALFRRPAGGPCLGAGTWGAPVFCEASTVTNQYYVWNGLVPNTQYYLMVDGSAGSQCVWNLRLGGGLSAPMPVTLSAFKAERQGDNNLVSWQAAREEAFSHYEVEHATEVPFFSEVGRVQASSTGQLSYRFTDGHASAGWHHYRLRMVDLDGSVAYSEVASVLVEERPGELQLYPNPAQGVLGIHCVGNPVMAYSVLTPDGREVLRGIAGGDAGPVEVELAGLRPGIYFLSATHTDHTVQVKKFTKL